MSVVVCEKGSTHQFSILEETETRFLSIALLYTDPTCGFFLTTADTRTSAFRSHAMQSQPCDPYPHTETQNKQEVKNNLCVIRTLRERFDSPMQHVARDCTTVNLSAPSTHMHAL